MGPQIEIQLIAAIVAGACCLPGVFLILRKMAMMSDAISHSILLGIVIAFFIFRDLNSPFLMIAAAATGLMTVYLVELIRKTALLKEDASIGIVFPLLFSLGVILVSRFAKNVHLDTDAVLLGELAFAPFHRFQFFGHDIGPKALYNMLIILLLNLSFIAIFFKELKLIIFDPELAQSLGFHPQLFHYILMGLVSLTAVGAFDAVGSILVVALMIGPPAAAYLLTQKLLPMLVFSLGSGFFCAISGYWVARWGDVSIAGSITTVIGLFFGLTLLFSPQQGLIFTWQKRRRQKLLFSLKVFLVHISNHAAKQEARIENHCQNIDRHLHWDPTRLNKVLKYALKHQLIYIDNQLIHLTATGKKMAVEAFNF
jgi:manganese/zinc/iron transport system permease protein